MRELKVPVDFLLASPSPWVRLQTRVELLGEPAPRERRELVSHPVVKRLTRDAAQWPAGTKGDHRSGKDLLNKLSLLADFGLRSGDPEIGTFVERVLARTGSDGRLLGYVLFPKRSNPEWMFDVDGQDTLLALVSLGFAEDDRVRRALAALLALESAGGGWVWPEARSPLPCRRFAGGCPYPTLKVLRILARTPRGAESDAARRGVELVLSLWERRNEERRYGFGMGSDFAKLRYPFIWFDVLHVVEALSPYGWAWSDARFRELLDLVVAKADADGRFTPESVSLEWKDLCFGQKREPSPFLTFVVHRILRREPRRSGRASSARPRREGT